MLKALNGWKKLGSAILVIPLMSWLRSAGIAIPEEMFHGVMVYIGAQGISDFGKGSKAPTP